MLGTFLLQRTCRKWQWWLFGTLSFFDLRDFVHRSLQILIYFLQFFFSDIFLFLRIAVIFCQKRLFTSFYRKFCFHTPIFRRNKRIDLCFSVGNNTQCHGLHASRTKSAFYLLPQQRADGISHDTVKHTSCLLGIHKIHINLARLFDSLAHRIFCNFIKCNTFCLFRIQFQCEKQMPGNRFPFTVGVRREIDLICFFYFFSKRSQQFPFSSYRYIFGFKIIIKINTHLTFRQITNVSVRRHYRIITSEKFFDRF